MVRGMHEAVVTNVLGAVEIKVASISTILTVKQLQRMSSECRSRLMMTWVTEQSVDIIFIVDNNRIPDCTQRWEW
jgi:Tfp pilus assembly protein PilV